LNSISSAVSTSGSIITLTGEKFDLGASCKVSMINNITSLTTLVIPNSCNSTTIIFTLPSSIEAGFYYVSSLNDPLGQSNPILLQVNLFLGSPTSAYISVNGGVVSYSGTGLPSTWPNSYYNTISLSSNGKYLPLNVISSSTTSLVISIPPGANNTIYVLTVVSPTMNSFSKSFSQQTLYTPAVSLTS
jgi:hypothetical protein